MYLIGIDGGGTSTQGTITDRERLAIASLEVGATNYHSVGLEVAGERLLALIEGLLAKADALMTDVWGICLGGAGIDCQQDVAVIENLFRNLGFTGELIVVNDAITALAGGNQSLQGAILICGTGSVSYGVSEEKTVRVGGWGHLLDDDGSGYQLGIKALRHVMRSYDGREGHSLLWQQIKTHLNLNSPEDLMPFIHHPKTTKDQIAALAPLVLEAAITDDSAKQIVDDALGGALEMVVALYEQLGLKPMPLTIGGSLLVKSDDYRAKFQHKLSTLGLDIQMHLPYEGPVEGALRIIQNKFIEKEGKR